MNIKILIMCSMIALAGCNSQDSQNKSIEIHASQWISDTTDPADSIGQNKDFYINSVSGDFFEKIGGIWVAKGKLGGSGTIGDKGDKGDKGDTGDTGLSTKWLSGIVVPTTQGNDGDFYYNTVTNDVYEKISGTWSVISNIKGLQGIQGIKGDKGDIGNTGATGAQGIQGIQGLKGDTGLTGSQGIQGLKGDKGDIGDTGAQGIQGIQGVQGDKGDKGDNGLSTIAGKNVQISDPGADKDVLVYDQSTQTWITTKVDLLNTTGSLSGARVSGDISGKASGITGIIEMIQVNGLGAALSSITDDIIQLFSQKADKTQVATDIVTAKNEAAADATLKANSAKSDANTYTDGKVATINSNLDLKADKTQVATDISTAKDEAAVDATNKANLAESNSNSYTDGKVSVLNSNIADKVSITTYDANNVAINSNLDLKADKTQVATDIATAKDEAAVDATAKSNNAELNSKTYTDNKVTTLNSDIAGKLSLAGGTMTGDLALKGQTDSDELISNPSLSLADKAKMWFNTTVNRIKFWDGSSAKQVAIKDEVDLKVDTTTYDAAIFDINDSISGVITQADTTNTLAQSAATGLTYKADTADLKALAYKDIVGNADISDVEGSKITGSVSSSMLTGFIDGLAKTLTGVTNLVTTTFTATTGTITTLNSTNIVASGSIKVGANDVLTTASTIPSASISDASLGGVANKVLKLGTDGKIDSAALPSISATLVDNSSGKFIQAGTNNLGNANVNLISTGGSLKVSSTDVNSASGLLITNDANGATATSIQEAAVDVQGSIISRTYSNPVTATNNINMKRSNAIRYRYSVSALSAVATEPISLSGLVDGGAYSIIIDGSSATGCRANGADGSCVRTGAATYSFASSGFTFKYLPVNTAADLGKDTIYNFMVVGNIVYVNWSSGF